MRRRVDILHRAMDQRGASFPEFSQELIDPDLTRRSASVPVPGLEECLPYTLDHHLREEMQRHRSRTNPAVSAYLLGLANDFAGRMTDREPNPKVVARFAVEKAIAVASLSLDCFCHHVPPLFINGDGFDVGTDPVTGKEYSRPTDWSGLSPMDLNAIKRLEANLDSISDTKTLEATWQPAHPSTVLTADCIRPPVESLVLAAKVLRGRLSDREPHVWGTGSVPAIGKMAPAVPVLCIGLGFVFGAQALSARLPDSEIHHLSVPYLHVEAPGRNWEATVLNLPSTHQWDVARSVGRRVDLTHLQWRAILRGPKKKVPSAAHVVQLVNLAARFRASGKPLFLLTDASIHRATVQALNDLVEPLIVNGLDTTRKGIWVGYRNPPWAPHRMPRPTGRLLSVWRWK